MAALLLCYFTTQLCFYIKMIIRDITSYATAAFSKYPVITITGPRQSGKTTLARSVFIDKPYANLENPVTRQFAEEDPLAFLKQYPDCAVIDEIQRVPGLLSYIQVIIDDKQQNSLFVLTGSQQFELMRSISQSLGRVMESGLELSHYYISRPAPVTHSLYRAPMTR